MSNDIPYFSITYQLFERDGSGNLKLFDSTKSLYVANVEAETSDEAEAKLKQDFSMLIVKIVSASEKLFVPREGS